MLPPVILILALVIVLITALVGLARGFKRFYPSLIVIAASAAVALIAALVLKSTFGAAVGELIRELVASGEADLVDEITASMPTAAAFVEALPTALAAPFVFAVCFGVIVVVADIVRAIVTAVIRSSKKAPAAAPAEAAKPEPALTETAETAETAETPAAPAPEAPTPEAPTPEAPTPEAPAAPAKQGKKRLLGLLAGAVGGLITAFCLLLPLIGYLGMANAALTQLEQVSPDAVDGVFADADTKTAYDSYVDPIISDPYIRISYTTGGKAVFNLLSSVKVGGSSYPVSELAETGLNIYSHVTPFIGKAPADYGQEQIDAVDAVAHDIGDDLLLRNLGAEFVAGLASAWEKGESFLGIEPLEIEGEFAPVIDKLISSFATVSSATVSSDLQDVSDLFAVLIEYRVFGSLSDENTTFRQVLTTPSFITDLCTAVQKSPRLEPVFFEVAKLGVNLVAEVVGIPADAQAAAGSDRITAQDITAVLHEVSPDDAANESRRFEEVVTAALAVADSLDGEDADILRDIDAQAVEDVMVALSETETFGDSVDLLLHGICQSNLLANTGFSGENLYRDMAAGGYDNIANTLQTVKHTVRMFEILSSKPSDSESSAGGSGSTDAGSAPADTAAKADVKEEIQWIVTNMTPQTSAIITGQITEETVQTYGISEQASVPVSNLISNMFESMSKENEMTEEEYKNESDAISNLFSVATDLAEGTGGENIFGETVSSASEITETVLNSKVVSDALLSTAVDENGEVTADPLALEIELSEEDKTALVSALNDYSTRNIPASADSETETQKITALAAVFNVNISIDANGVVTYLGN